MALEDLNIKKSFNNWNNFKTLANDNVNPVPFCASIHGN